MAAQGNPRPGRATLGARDPAGAVSMPPARGGQLSAGAGGPGGGAGVSAGRATSMWVALIVLLGVGACWLLALRQARLRVAHEVGRLTVEVERQRAELERVRGWIGAASTPERLATLLGVPGGMTNLADRARELAAGGAAPSPDLNAAARPATGAAADPATDPVPSASPTPTATPSDMVPIVDVPPPPEPEPPGGRPLQEGSDDEVDELIRRAVGPDGKPLLVPVDGERE